MEFEHNGIKITMNGKGEFTATDRMGEFVRKGSLKAMQVHLDKQAASGFKTFTALNRHDRRDDGLERVEVIGVEKITGSGSRRHQSQQFRAKKPDGEIFVVSPYQSLYRDCKEATAAYKAARKYRQETEQIDRERSKEQEKLDEALAEFRLDPNQPDFNPKKIKV